MEAVADADLVLVVLDASQAETSADNELLADVNARQSSAIVVENKWDLVTAKLPAGNSHLRTSALTGEGIPELRSEILRHIGGDASGDIQQESGFLTNIRHQKLVADALAALDAAADAVDKKTPHEMMLLDLYNALRPLDEITGATTTDDILALIFSRFCIGK